MTNAKLLHTWVTPNGCGIRRGSGCPLATPRLNTELSRWLMRYPCQMCSGHWPHLLPSSGNCCWSHLSSSPSCEETISPAVKPAVGYPAPLSRLGCGSSPSWECQSSPRSLELILLSLRQDVVDGVLHLAVVGVLPRGGGLPGSIGHNIVAGCSKG
jgi:hypothetical protein